MSSNHRVATALLLALSAVIAGERPCEAQTGALAAIRSTTRDIKFKSHDGHDMLGRLTLPDTPGVHSVLVLVQNAEAQHMEPTTRNPRRERVKVYSLYRDYLTPLNIGFFTYEGRGVFSLDGGGRTIDRPVYDTSTLENKVRDAIAAVRVLQKDAGVDASQIFLRAISEGTLLAADVATRIPGVIKGLVLSGVVATTLKDALVFMATDGAFMAHAGHWDANSDGTITEQEFEADPKGIRKQLPATIRFRNFDVNGDGAYVAADTRATTTSIVEAIRAENYDGFEPWLKANAGVPVPDPMRDWLKEHFRHAPMWDLVSRLEMPVGFFQGELDANTPAAAVRALEQKAKTGGKVNFEFHYFAKLNHGLGTLDYVSNGTPSAGYAAIFDFMKRHTSQR